MMKEPLEELAKHYNGSIQFAFVNTFEDELLKYSFDAYKPPRSNFVALDGNSYGFEPILTGKAGVISWIDDEKYLKSPQVFKAPKRIKEWALPIYY